MPRRSHKKSRQGCHECKRRHLKCDETHPTCMNCRTAQLRCPYEDDRRPFGQQEPSTNSIQNSGTPSTSNLGTHANSSTSSEAAFNLSPYVPLSTDGSALSSLNTLHLELLYFWSRSLYKSFLMNNGGNEVYVDVCFNHGLQHPFLMRQILATSALSMSLRRPERREYYHQHSAQLQSEALTEFNAALKNLTESNIVAAFLVSSLIGLHTFCETFSFRDDNFNHVLDAFIGCTNLLRGIRSIIGHWWPFLLSTELNPILTASSTAREKGKEATYRLDSLRELIETADIGLTSKKAYALTVEELEQVYAIQTELRDPEGSESANMIFTWLVLVPKEYVDCLAQRRPEALIILAYYAVILHRRRKFWAINDAGHFLIEGISAHLGRHWDHWLNWPDTQIQT